MAKRKQPDPLLRSIELALMPGQFVSYGQAYAFVHGLEKVMDDVVALAESGEAERAIPLFESLLVGCYEKMEAIDDSGGTLSDFFTDLFVAWVKACDAAGRDPNKTVAQIRHWVENDDYCLSYGVEKQVLTTTTGPTAALLRQHLHTQFDESANKLAKDGPKELATYPAATRMAAETLAACYVAVHDLDGYLSLTEKIMPTPGDCENIAGILMAKKRSKDALGWVEKGLALRESPNARGGGHRLADMQRSLLRRFGRKREALDLAWSAFQSHPCSFSYDDLMKCVPRGETEQWRSKSLQYAERNDLRGFLEIASKQKAWDALADRIEAVDDEEIEAISHYTTEPVAKALMRRHPVAAARICCAMAMRIIEPGKSKYYQAALDHLRQARVLYLKHGREDLWRAVAARIRQDHGRKYSLMGEFEAIDAGESRRQPLSFAARTQKLWRQQTTKKRRKTDNE